MVQIKLQLDWKPNAQFAGVLYAHYHGLYKQNDIDLEIIPWNDYTDTIDVLDNEGLVVASAEDNLIIKARAKGKPIIAIGTMMQYSGIGWMSLKSKNIYSFQDLKGKRVGIHNDGEVAVDVALKNANLTREDVEVVIVGYDYSELLVSGELDAMQCLIMVEPLEMETLGHHVNIISGRSQGYSVYAQVLAINRQLLSECSDIWMGFLQATFSGWRHALLDPYDVSKIISQTYLKDSTPELQKKMLDAMKPIIIGDVGIDHIGWMENTRWERSISYLIDQKNLSNPMRPEDVMTNHFMEVIYR